MHPILGRLAGGDRRSIGEAEAVAREIEREPALFEAVFEGMLCSDPVVRMRAADAVEKASRQRPALLEPYKRRLLDEVASADQQEVRWHVAQMVPRLQLDAEDRLKAVTMLEEYLSDESKIVRVNAMQALADLARDDDSLRQTVVPKLERVLEVGSPAERARARKLLKELSRKRRHLSD